MSGLGSVLVLGGGGWVGSALVLQLLRRKQELGVTALTLADLPRAPRLPWLRAKAEAAGLVERALDVCDPEAVQRLFEELRPRTVFNLAAVIDMRPEVCVRRMEAVNALAVDSLLRAAEEVSA
ncbi:unnamed protein product, partial [Effrenium voratum]